MVNNKKVSFNGKELSIWTLEKIMKEFKLSKVLSNYGLEYSTAKVKAHNIESIKNRTVALNFLKNDIISILEADKIDQEEIEAARCVMLYLGGPFAERIKNRADHMYCDFYSTSYEFLKNTAKAYNRFYPNNKNIEDALDIISFIYKNSDYDRMFKSLFKSIENMDSNISTYYSFLDFKDIYMSILKDKNRIYLGDIDLVNKLHSIKCNFEDRKPKVTKEYVDSLKHLSDSEHIIEGFFKMLEKADFSSEALDLNTAIEYSKKLFHGKEELYLEDSIFTEKEGFIAYDYAKNSIKDLCSITTSIIRKKELLHHIYDIWGANFIDDCLWGLIIEDGSSTEIQQNREIISDYNCYYYSRECYLYGKPDNYGEKDEKQDALDKERIINLIDHDYTQIKTISYSSETIDKFIDDNSNINNDKIVELTRCISKINITLAKLSYNISEAEIVTKDSPLFPKDCQNKYAIISISSRAGEILDTVDIEEIEKTYINYLDIDNIENIREGIDNLKSLLKKYKS